MALVSFRTKEEWILILQLYFYCPLHIFFFFSCINIRMLFIFELCRCEYFFIFSYIFYNLIFNTMLLLIIYQFVKKCTHRKLVIYVFCIFNIILLYVRFADGGSPTSGFLPLGSLQTKYFINIDVKLIYITMYIC